MTGVEWYERWFGEEYLELYPHRDDKDAARLVDFLAELVPLDGCRLLDLACGTGRHAILFVRHGAVVTGLDLSIPLLRRGHDRYGRALEFVRGDIRSLPFRRGAFGLAVNLFTSFGYFTNDTEHGQALAEAFRVLRPGGSFVLDYLNTTHVVENIVPYEEQRLGRHRAVIRRRVSDDGLYVIKEIRLPEEGRRYKERVRLFSPDELADMLGASGLDVTRVYGDYDGGTVGPHAPRAIFLTKRS